MHSSDLLFLSNLFSSDMIIIVFVALLLFGGEKLPEIARGLGKGIRDFKDATDGVKREINNQINSYEEKKAEIAINNQAEITQNQISSGTLAENHPGVENTMPMNEYNFNVSESAVTDNDNHIGAKNEPATENQVAAPHVDTETAAEPTKRTQIRV
jgi:sec-independent protein translocase protein TatA